MNEIAEKFCQQTRLELVLEHLRDLQIKCPTQDISGMEYWAKAKSTAEYVESFLFDIYGEEVTICPYCGDQKDPQDYRGCCGESNAHFTTTRHIGDIWEDE